MTDLQSKVSLTRCLRRHGAALLGLVLLPAAAASEVEPPVVLMPIGAPVSIPEWLWPGGLDPRPMLLSITPGEGEATVTWTGLRGPFRLQTRPVLGTSPWQPSGEWTQGTTGHVAMTEISSLIRVEGGNANYVGQPEFWNCGICHPGTHGDWSHTAHADALQSLKNIGMDKNSRCVQCHTVGHTLPNGYVDEPTTPHLANVQCENCHGPAGSHLANFDDLSVRPAITIAANVCGGCHTDFHHPTFDEWELSGHAHMTEDNFGFSTATGDPNYGRMMQCGPCHSGSVRVALLNQLTSPSPMLPTGQEAQEFPVTCAVCHDPHGMGANGDKNQVRNPLYSLANFSYTASTNLTSFAAQYDPNIQICAQCHNQRGAKWTDTSRPPHHSPQYNMLLGQGGYDLGVSKIATHGWETEKQCASCHVYALEAEHPTADTPNYMGHTFAPGYESCVDCHGSAEGAEAFVEATRLRFEGYLIDVVDLLDTWATTKAPAELRDKYGKYSWEYTNEGVLSNPAGDPTIVGPSSADQAKIPDAIKQARMNLYLVEHDGSYGTHNGLYARHLIEVARTNVLAELAKP